MAANCEATSWLERIIRSDRAATAPYWASRSATSAALKNCGVKRCWKSGSQGPTRTDIDARRERLDRGQHHVDAGELRRVNGIGRLGEPEPLTERPLARERGAAIAEAQQAAARLRAEREVGGGHADRLDPRRRGHGVVGAEQEHALASRNQRDGPGPKRAPW